MLEVGGAVHFSSFAWRTIPLKIGCTLCRWANAEGDTSASLYLSAPSSPVKLEACVNCSIKFIIFWSGCVQVHTPTHQANDTDNYSHPEEEH